MKSEAASWLVRYGPVLRGLGLLFHVPAVMALVSLPICLAADGGRDWRALAATLAAALIAGQVLFQLCRRAPATHRHHAMLIAAIAWLGVAALAALPFVLVSPGLPVLDALFESLAAFTGTGLSVIAAPQDLPHFLQWWRSLSQWIGGVGVVVLLLAVLPPSRGALELYYSEGRGRKILPGVNSTVRTIWSLYLGYTIAAVGLLWLAGEPAWRALNHGMTAIATGGMTITGDSLASASDAVKLAYLPILIAGAISFAVHYRVWRQGEWRAGLFGGLEQRFFWAILGGGALLLAAQNHFSAADIRVVDSLLQWVSAVTTTGFQSVDVNQWPLVSQLWLLPVMIAGAMAGSTCGGLKLARLAMLYRAFLWSLKTITRRPHQVLRFVYDGEVLDRADATDRVRAATVLSIGWGLLLVFGVIALAHTAPVEWTFSQIVFETVSAQNNIGLSSGITGPEMPAASKLVLMLLMWMGRLEIVPAMVLLALFLERR